MYVSPKSISLVGIAVLICLPAFSHGQGAQSGSLRQGFSVVTAVGLSFSGPKVSTTFKLTDELGLDYDVMSLVSDSEIRAAIELSSEQHEKMSQLSKSVTSKMAATLATQLMTSDPKQGLEPQFRDLESSLRDVLRNDQSARLDRARIQSGIKQFGIARYLATDTMRSHLGLTEEDVRVIVKKDSELKRRLAVRMDVLNERANQELLALLSMNQRREFDRFFSDSNDEFMLAPLFITNKSLKHRSSAANRPLLGLLKRRTIQDVLELSDSQIDSIASLNKEYWKMGSSAIQSAIDEIISPGQVRRLQRVCVAGQIKKYGTVNALGHGVLSMVLQLSSEESDRIHPAGREIWVQLKEDVKQLRIETHHETVGSLSKKQQALVLGDTEEM